MSVVFSFVQRVGRGEHAQKPKFGFFSEKQTS